MTATQGYINAGFTPKEAKLLKGIDRQSATVAAPNAVTVTGSAAATYSANEQTMVNALKADVTNLRSTLNTLVTNLKAAGIVL